MKETAIINFLYSTIPGRGCLKILTQPWFSKCCSLYLDSHTSAWMVPFFIKKYQIDMREYSLGPYHSFNDFFTRKRQDKLLKYEEDQLVSPCDGWPSIHKISSDKIFKIKNATYDISQLLRDPMLADKYSNGLCFIFRMTPQHYHRYSYSCSGEASATRRIKGILHCVRPIAYGSRSVYTENCRAYEIIRSQKFGDVIQMEVGALMIGKICNHPHKMYVEGLQEKGFFAFGGSTIIILLQADKIIINDKIKDAFFKEISVRQAYTLGYMSGRECGDQNE